MIPTHESKCKTIERTDSPETGKLVVFLLKLFMVLARLNNPHHYGYMGKKTSV